mmetsp:Transcript_8847/g.32871  ORF Transcript_8847/g.32871 Transcript_8847/m.32871 type:complete len:232 (+) Transcript_8847:7136-7831(+)
MSSLASDSCNNCFASRFTRASPLASIANVPGYAPHGFSRIKRHKPLSISSMSSSASSFVVAVAFERALCSASAWASASARLANASAAPSNTFAPLAVAGASITSNSALVVANFFAYVCAKSSFARDAGAQNALSRRARSNAVHARARSSSSSTLAAADRKSTYASMHRTHVDNACVVSSRASKETCAPASSRVARVERLPLPWLANVLTSFASAANTSAAMAAFSQYGCER